MRPRTLIPLAAAVVLLTACIPSVFPFYTEKDVILEPALVGHWKALDGEDEPEYWTFEEPKSGETEYRLTITEGNGAQGTLRATLFELKGHRFLDLIPAECDYATNQADIVAASMFPGHLLMHVAQTEPTLKVAFCDFDWLGKQLDENPKLLAHHREEDRLLLTASTKQLQRFVLKHVDGGELFSEYGELERQSADEE